ncbi:MAG: hypothetical protein CMO74_05500 [Verrucomicrobiales bacterium]|nr:hypothetical protein [Verrucomicrobiales bacterium]|tara:strand:+ start:29 stop:868 length:840 start_codon:yes stop_codon:yes gene_type:complete
MKQGTSTVIGLLTFLLLATFGAAAYFVSQAYSAQKGRSAAIQKAEGFRKNAAELEATVTQLETEWQDAVAQADSAITQLEQFRGLAEEQDKEIEYLMSNLHSVSNQLAAAAAVEQNLNQSLVQVNQEKLTAIETVAELRDKLDALEKEFKTLKDSKPAVLPVVPVPGVAGLSQEEVVARLEELKNLKAKLAAAPPAATPGNEGVSGRVREVNVEFGFVILDIGAPDGLKVGDRLSVSRASEPVGQLRVRKLHSGLSVCDILTEKTAHAIQLGDRVDLLK